MANASEGSLMKRTKAELVNIILRKDEVETNHSEEIKSLKESVSNFEREVESYREEIDDYVADLKDCALKLRKHKAINYIIGFVAFVLLLILIF